MYPCNYSSGQITSMARRDLIRFLDSVPREGVLYKAFQGLRQELNASKNSIGDLQKVSKFLKQYLAWAENRYPIKFKKATWESYFLKALRSWLLQFTLSSIQDFNTVRRAPRIQEFGRYVAAHCCFPEKGLNIAFLSAFSEHGFDLKKFPSWLVMSNVCDDLFVIYDHDEIILSTVDARQIERRYELITLHEIAHARLHLKTLRGKLSSKQRQATALPCDELEAWLYAKEILGHVAGLRARISRLLNETDKIGLV